MRRNLFLTTSMGEFSKNKCIFKNCSPFLSGRDEAKLKVVEEYLKAKKMFRNYDNAAEDPVFSQVNF